MKSLPGLHVFAYAYAKDVFLPTKLRKHEFTMNMLATLLSMLLLMITVIILTPCVVVKFCAFIILKLMHGKLFGGFLTGADLIFEENSNTVINVILLHSCSIDKPDAQIQMLRKLVDQIHNSSYKFSSTIEKLFGLLYYIKNQVKPEEILEIVDDKSKSYLTKSKLYDYIEQNCYTINGNHTWRAIAFAQPIRWNEDNGNKKQYVTVLTVRHSVGDGFALMCILKNIFNQDNKTEHVLTGEIANRRGKIDFSGTCIHTNMLSVNIGNPLLKIRSKSNWHLVTYVEPKPTYLSLIKKIKKQLNIGFVDVIGTACCASVQDYIAQKRNLEMDTLVMGNVVRVYEREEKEIINKTYNLKKLGNTSSMEMYTLSFGTNERSMKEKILFVHRISKSLKNSLDFLVSYVVSCDTFPYVPNNLSGFLRNKLVKRMTVGVTNLVGFDKSSYCNFSVDDICFSVPNCLKIGFLFCIFSYDGRIGISLQSARGYVHNREELQTILEDTFKYIDKAGREILNDKIDT